MSACVIVGDSLAIGLAQQMPECRLHARIGAGSAAIARFVVHESASLVVISTGSNDGPARAKVLTRLRHRFDAARRVVWIVPANAAAAAVVVRVASLHGDALVRFRTGHDGIHPRSYRTLASAVRAAE